VKSGFSCVDETRMEGEERTGRVDTYKIKVLTASSSYILSLRASLFLLGTERRAEITSHPFLGDAFRSGAPW
jgi:hypothetical protein